MTEKWNNLSQFSCFHDDLSCIINQEVLSGIDAIKASGVKVNSVITSPPFYGQRDYGIDGQLGLEIHPSEYIEKLVDCFSECWDLLSDDGSLWVNLGDTYWSGRGRSHGSDKKQPARRFGTRPQDRKGDGVWARPKQLMLIPHRFAIAMQDQGWVVRNDNVWVKPNPIPDPTRDRCSMSHEYVFHFVKNRFYFFDQDRVARVGKSGNLVPPLDTWIVQTSKGGTNHKASFSEELIEIPLMSTMPPDGIVLDPFVGSGTTVLRARRLGFRGIGIDLKPEYCDDIVSRLIDSK